MARRLNMEFLAAVLIAAFLQSSVSGQTTHVVGNALGWAIPSGDSAAYFSWAANQTFRVGDILVFNFAAGAHDVAQVTKANYDACTSSNPILLQTASPARITLNASGEHYYICNFAGHCSAGQKLMINVSAASSSPAPTPSTTASPTPSPQPSATPRPAPAPSPTQVSAPSPTQVSAPSPSSSSSPTTSPPESSATPPSSTTTPSSPSPTGSVSPPPPPGNSATSLGVAGFTTFLSILVAFC